MNEELTFEDYKEIVSQDKELTTNNYILAKLSAIEAILINKNIISQEDFDKCFDSAYNTIIKLGFEKLSDLEKDMMLTTKKISSFFK